jgi:hypothetical protein
MTKTDKPIPDELTLSAGKNPSEKKAKVGAVQHG